MLTRPLWVDPDRSIFPRLEEDISVDVAVIGGGISGVGAARWLEHSGVTRVAVVDARTVCAGASGRNAGFVMALAPENFPQTRDPKEIDVARRIWAFTAENQRMIESAMSEFEIEAEYRKLGSLGLAATTTEWERTLAAADIARAAGARVEIVSRGDLPSLWLRDRYYGGAIFLDNSEIHPGRFVHGLAKQLAGRGVRFYEHTSVLSFAKSGQSVELRTPGGVIKADGVIVATNGYTLSLLPDLGRSIQATRGQVLATASTPQTVAERPVYANSGYQYWRQTLDGRVVLGGWRDVDIANEVGTEDVLNQRIQTELDSVIRGLTGQSGIVEYRWSGIMGFTPDRRPLVGAVPGWPHMTIAAGYSGHGMAMAFHAAKHAVAMLRGDPSEVADMFRPVRFSAPA
ncbi:MAG TPA: FAD-dependent oxidoreductase [Chloroflexota bacterium]|nr:FAD-dependent oxidoreductase [Chloroflexota bacterium]